MKLSLLTATFFLCTSGCGEVGKLLPHQQTSLNTRNEIKKTLASDNWFSDGISKEINESDLIQDTLHLSEYVFTNKTTPEEKKLITHIAVNLKLDNIQRSLAEDNSSIVFCENWEENYILYPNFQYWLDDKNNPVLISKIADSNRDEIIIALSLDQIKRANIDHCLYDWYTGSENYHTQLYTYTQNDIINLLQQLRGWYSLSYKQ